MFGEHLFNLDGPDGDYQVFYDPKFPGVVTVWYDAGHCPMGISREQLVKMLAAIDEREGKGEAAQ